MVNAKLERTNETITEKIKSVVWGFVKSLEQLGNDFIIEPIRKRLRQLMDLVLRIIHHSPKRVACAQTK